MTHLVETLPHSANIHLDARLYGDSIGFLHKVAEGPASQSYGVEVAKLAGIPSEVIHAAKLKLGHWESQSFGPAKTNPEPVVVKTAVIDPGLAPILAQLRALDPDKLSPREALEWIYKLSSRV
jgi:DNA mismatch repair protein MutS